MEKPKPLNMDDRIQIRIKDIKMHVYPEENVMNAKRWILRELDKEENILRYRHKQIIEDGLRI